MSRRHGAGGDEARAERLKAALRANLRRRKEQQRARLASHDTQGKAPDAPRNREG